MARVGKYELVRKIATGGMAEVYLARFEWALGLEKTVVVKRILPHLAQDPAFRQMFFSEAQLAAQLSHPGIAQIIEFGESDGTYFLSMELVDGLSLRQLEHSFNERQEVIPFACSARIAACCCEALAHAHDLVDSVTGEPLNLVHRDISPDNILLARNGAVKLVDFGIAKAATQSHHTQTGHIKGKLAYMPPEQLRAKDLDRRADVYALGVVLYEMLSGARPFEAPTDASLMASILTDEMVPLRQRCPDVPEALDRIVHRALQRNREDRYPDCRAMHTELEEALLSSRQSASAFQLAQLVAHDSETSRWADKRTARALVTPDKPQPTAKTPLPRRSEGTDSKRQAAAAAIPLEQPMGRTGTDDAVAPTRHSRSRPSRERTAPAPRIAPAPAPTAPTVPYDPLTEEELATEGPTLREPAPPPQRRRRRPVIAVALSVAGVLAAVTAVAAARTSTEAKVSPTTPAAEVAHAVPIPDTPEVEPAAPLPDEPATPPPPTLQPARSAVKPVAPLVELALRSEPPAQLKVLAGRKVVAEGRSPLTARVAPGTVTVEASATGEHPFFRRETLTLGATVRQVSHAITPGQGFLNVRTFPAAHVTVDGVARGDVPLRISLLEGQHSVRLECDQRLPRCAGQPVITKAVVIEPGKSLEVMHKWH